MWCPNYWTAREVSGCTSSILCYGNYISVKTSFKKGEFKDLEDSGRMTDPQEAQPLCAATPPPPPLPHSANVWKLILTFQDFRKASSTGDKRCGAWGPSVLGRERVNGPCVTVCICYIFYSPLFKLILEAQHIPNLHRVSGFSSSPACLRGSPSPSFDSFS